jgi:hypothetical protein
LEKFGQLEKRILKERSKFIVCLKQKFGKLITFFANEVPFYLFVLFFRIYEMSFLEEEISKSKWIPSQMREKYNISLNQILRRRQKIET